LTKYVLSIAVDYKNKASDQIMKGERTAAVHYLNHALELDETDWVCRFKRAVILAEMNHHDGAIEDLQTVLNDPNHDTARDKELKDHLASVYNQMGVELFQNGDSSTALQLFTVAHGYNPTEPIILVNRADIPSTLADLHASIYLSPDDESSQDARKRCGELRFILGEQAFGRGEWGTAVMQWTRALEYDPTVADYYYKRARAYYLLENLDKSLQDVTIALSLYPSHPECIALHVQLTTGNPPLHTLAPFPPQKPKRGSVPVGVVPDVQSGIVGKTVTAPLYHPPPPTAPNMLPSRTPLPESRVAHPHTAPSTLVAESHGNVLDLPPLELPVLSVQEGGPNAWLRGQSRVGGMDDAKRLVGRLVSPPKTGKSFEKKNLDEEGGAAVLSPPTTGKIVHEVELKFGMFDGLRG
ncbi:Tetratricopeptide repeat protein 16, partial [Borealophlyctis nickersoniae]